MCKPKGLKVLNDGCVTAAHLSNQFLSCLSVAFPQRYLQMVVIKLGSSAGGSIRKVFKPLLSSHFTYSVVILYNANISGCFNNVLVLIKCVEQKMPNMAFLLPKERLRTIYQKKTTSKRTWQRKIIWKARELSFQLSSKYFRTMNIFYFRPDAMIR